MSKSIKRVHSLKSMIRRHDLLLAALMVAVCLCGLFLNQLISRQYGAILERSLWLNSYKLALEDARSSLQIALYGKGSEEETELETAMLVLYQQGEALPDRLQHPALWRSAEDLRHMTQTFLQLAGSAQRLVEGGFLEAATPIYLECEHLYELMLTAYGDCNDLLVTVNRDGQALAQENTNRLLISQTLFSVGILIFSFAILIDLVGRAVAPIERLTQRVAVISVEKEVLPALPYEDSGVEEVDALSTAYSGFVNRINRQFERIKQTGQLEKQLLEEEAKNLRINNLLKASELKALQSRINPHFLFNSLNMITSLAYLEGAEQTTTVMELLGSYLRYNLDKFNKVVTVADEVENVRDYLRIQQTRMGATRLDFSIEMDESAGSAKIPCLVLQPLVENSISHGLHNRLENGRVHIAATADQQMLQILIEDNGDGMMEDQVRQLMQIQKENPLNQDDSDGIGVRNVIARLQLYYNGNVAVQINSTPGEGTTFLLKMPLWREEQSNELFNSGGRR